MTLTKEQWFQKLKSWVPSWYFEEAGNQEALFYSIAELLALAQADVNDNIAQTFISQATGVYLDLHGLERTVGRVELEQDPSYSTRIRYFTNQSNRPSIKALVDAILINGECQIAEDYDSGLFLDRGIYANRGQLIIEQIKSAFTIVFNNQTHSPYSFSDREYFTDRADFAGTAESPDSLFAAIVAAVNKAKAFGVLYRVYERAEE